MSIRLEVNGIQYTEFTSVMVEIRLDALSNSFAFNAVTSEKKPLPFKGGEACRVIVNNIPVLTGFIEIVSGSYDAGSHSISVQGRDKTADLVDSTLGSISDLNQKITLKSVTEKIIKHIGASIEVFDDVGPDPFEPYVDLQAPEPGDNAFQFLETLARKRQVLLSSDSDGNVVITRASGVDEGAALQNLIGANDNNILNGSYDYNQTGRFNLYKSSSSLNPVVSSGAKPSELVNQEGTATDDIRQGRQFVFVPEDNYSIKAGSDRALWEANVRKARGQTCTYTVQGFEFSDGQLWGVNQVVNVQDDFAEIYAKMLINSVTYAFDVDNGSTTVLSIVEKNAYTLTLQEPKAQKIG